MIRLDLHRLTVFNTVVNEGSLSRAGRRLFMSQPAISAHIKLLEEQLGMPLFYRAGRRSVVNRAGEMLFKRSQELFSVADALQADMEDMRGVSTGRLTLGASTDWQYHLPEALDQFKRMYPGIDLAMLVGNSDHVENLLLDRRVDLAFIGRATSRTELASNHLADEWLVPVCSPCHRFAGMGTIDSADLKIESLIVREVGSVSRMLTDKLLVAHDLQQNIYMELGCYESIKRAVMAGSGIGVVARTALDAELSAGLLCVADIPQLTSVHRLYIAYHKEKKMTIAQEKFMEVAAKNGAVPVHA